MCPTWPWDVRRLGLQGHFKLLNTWATKNISSTHEPAKEADAMKSVSVWKNGSLMKATFTLKQRSWKSFDTAKKKSVNHHFCTTARNVSSLLIYFKTLFFFFFWSACYEMDPFLSTPEHWGIEQKLLLLWSSSSSFIRCFIGEVCSFINHVSFSQTGTTLSRV